MNKLLLNRAGSGQVYFISVLHVTRDFLEKLRLQSSLLIMQGVLVGVSLCTRIFHMSDDGKFFGVGVADDGGMMVVHPNAELLLMIY